jgi:NADPH-dependent 2,4-dienoyl-CoA reductase/sulfur reductase-like enzyme
MNREARQFDVLVVGGGPAGLAAATCAAECGQHIGLVDDNPGTGGQIWRREDLNPVSVAGEWTQRLKTAGGELFCGTRVFHQPRPGLLLAECLDQDLELSYRRLVLATGARERFLPFPGWTLPNVTGAGGLQALVKSGLPIAGKRVVVAGSGPLLLAVAAYLQSRGAKVVSVCEQASWASLATFGAALLLHPHKITEGLALRRQLSGVPYSPNSWPVRAEGTRKLESVTISRNHKLETLVCDYLAFGFHLVPNTELAALLGCRLNRGFVEVDDLQQASVPGVFCAGEPTGIGGLELSLVEGQIAGFSSADRSEKARKLFGSRHRLRKFARTMDRVFAPRSELKTLPQSQTMVCRCEDVTFGSLSGYTSWRAAKLQTRCGMGPCQGRICGPIAQFLFDWRPDPVRPPIFPARLSGMARLADSETQNSQSVTGGDR